MAERMGFGQVDANNRVIPRWETQRQTQPLPAQAPTRSPYDMVLDVLQDPRNAWIGMSPVGAATRIPGLSRSLARIVADERGSFNPFGWGKKPAPQPDSGGFFPSLKQMQTAAPDDITQGGRDMHQAYIDHIIGMNRYVDTFQPNNPLHVQELMRLELNRPQLAEDIAKTSIGKMALDKEKGKAFDPSMETNPPLQVRRLFGLE